jgi:hypothetical protein
MDEQISSLIRSMIRTERGARSTPAAVALRDIKREFASRGALGHGRLPTSLDEAAAAEYEVRARAYLGIAKRVVGETDTPWTDELAREIEQLLASELATDWQELLDLLRTAGRPGQQARIDAIDSSKTRLARTIEDDLALLVIRQDRTRLPLRELLSSPRYAAVLASWQKANDGFRAGAPNLANAAKDAVGAVETLARIVVGDDSLTFGESIKRLRSSGRVPGATLKGLEELWGIASDTPGVRHGGAAEDLSASTAHYMEDLSSAALRLLLSFDTA